MNKKKEKKYNKGFSLVETLVGAFVFIIVVGVVIGIFIQQIRLNRIAIAMISMNDAMGLTLEQISREIRTGYNFCTSLTPLTTGGAALQAQCIALNNDDALGLQDTVLQFINAKGKTVRYRINKTVSASSIEKGLQLSEFPGGVCIDGIISNDGQFCYQKITSDNVYMEKFKIILDHNDQDGTEYYPPRITLNMVLTSSEPDVKSYKISTNMQLSVSGRNF